MVFADDLLSGNTRFFPMSNHAVLAVLYLLLSRQYRFLMALTSLLTEIIDAETCWNGLSVK